jgi:hypothetical protein
MHEIRLFIAIHLLEFAIGAQLLHEVETAAGNRHRHVPDAMPAQSFLTGIRRGDYDDFVATAERLPAKGQPVREEKSRFIDYVEQLHVQARHAIS